MLNPTAIHTKDGQRFPVDSPIEVVQREKAKYKVGLGWTYRFKSGKAWLLVFIDQVTAFEFADKPEGFTDRSESSRPSEERSLAKRLPFTANYVDEL